MINQHPSWHLLGLGLLVLLYAIHCHTKRSGIFIVAIWNLTGVILHELSHLLVGMIFRAEPAGLSLFPHRDGQRWRLGSVSFSRITAWNAVPVALAPLSLVGAAYLVASFWFSWYKATLATTLGLYAVIFILLYNSLPSTQDLRVACNWRSLLVYGSLTLFIVAWSIWPAFSTLLRNP